MLRNTLGVVLRNTLIVTLRDTLGVTLRSTLSVTLRHTLTVTLRNTVGVAGSHRSPPTQSMAPLHHSRGPASGPGLRAGPVPSPPPWSPAAWVKAG